MQYGRGLQANFAFENSEVGDLAAQLRLHPDVEPRTQAAMQPTTLTRWQPEDWPVAQDWQPVISRFLRSEPAQHLSRFIQDRLAHGATVYPPQPFRALALTPLERVKVVILGQDPYHGPGQAQGLAFSVATGVALPPSLRNIFKEIARDSLSQEGAGWGGGVACQSSASKAQIPANGSLEAWARQGVLLLNTCLTVEQSRPASHTQQGWEVLTDEIIAAVAASRNPVVFMLWGAHAQAKRGLLANSVVQPNGASAPTGRPVPTPGAAPRLVLAANHPSPLSALRPPRPFIGCGHFGAANAFLIANGLKPVAWA